jgi:hypothetical protein
LAEALARYERDENLSAVMRTISTNLGIGD